MGGRSAPGSDVQFTCIRRRRVLFLLLLLHTHTAPIHSPLQALNERASTHTRAKGLLGLPAASSGVQALAKTGATSYVPISTHPPTTHPTHATPTVPYTMPATRGKKTTTATATKPKGKPAAKASKGSNQKVEEMDRKALQVR